jgi:hypothetical protein
MFSPSLKAGNLSFASNAYSGEVGPRFPWIQCPTSTGIRIELHSGIYDGKITGLSQETGEMEFLTSLEGEGRKTMKFALRDADFERFKDPGEWDDVFVVFPAAGAWFLLRNSK